MQYISSLLKTYNSYEEEHTETTSLLSIHKHLREFMREIVI